MPLYYVWRWPSYETVFIGSVLIEFELSLSVMFLSQTTPDLYGLIFKTIFNIQHHGWMSFRFAWLVIYHIVSYMMCLFWIFCGMQRRIKWYCNLCDLHEQQRHEPECAEASMGNWKVAHPYVIVICMFPSLIHHEPACMGDMLCLLVSSLRMVGPRLIIDVSVLDGGCCQLHSPHQLQPYIWAWGNRAL